MTDSNFYGVVEMMGHRRESGRLSEAEIAGKKFLKVDAETEDGTVTKTIFVAPDSIYAITPCPREHVVRPPNDMPALIAGYVDVADFDDDDFDGDGEYV